MKVNSEENTPLLTPSQGAEGILNACKRVTFNEALLSTVPAMGVIAIVIAQIFHSHNLATQCSDGTYDYTSTKWISIGAFAGLVPSFWICGHFWRQWVRAEDEEGKTKFLILTRLSMAAIAITAIWASILLPSSMHTCSDGS